MRLGFEWRHCWSWEESIQDLLEFRETHGHVRVLRCYAKNPSLGNWVSRIQQQYHLYQKKEATMITEEKTQQLSEEQVNELTAHGFEWDKLNLKWSD